MNKDTIKEHFFQKHQIDNIEYLEKYLNLIFNYEATNDNSYKEKHHILPICEFPEFEDADWNIVELKYEDHKLAHLWLFKAINIRKYQRPLNWMLVYKDSKEISNAAKMGWINLKSDGDTYKIWRNKRSEYMKSLSSEEQSRRANIFWKNISTDEYIEFCEKMKDLWTEEKKLEKSIQMNNYYSNPENIEKKRIESKNRWNSLSEEYREEFSEKMNIINKDEKKRKDASEKIKKLWKNEEFLKKMKNRRHRSGKKIKIIDIKGDEVIFNSMKELKDTHGIDPYRIRKYLDKNILIKEKDLKENKQLLNCRIESING